MLNNFAIFINNLRNFMEIQFENLGDIDLLRKNCWNNYSENVHPNWWIVDDNCKNYVTSWKWTCKDAKIFELTPIMVSTSKFLRCFLSVLLMYARLLALTTKLFYNESLFPSVRPMASRPHDVHHRRCWQVCLNLLGMNVWIWLSHMIYA